MRLRPYQKQAVQATLHHFRSSNEPACLVLPTGAGKSVIIAELARVAKGRVLVLAHVKELCEQNYQKYRSLCGGSQFASAGIYSAGLGRKDTHAPVTFASIQSVARNLKDFDASFSLLVIDECHRVSGEDGSQYSTVIDALRKKNSEFKLLGLTATPYRMGMGWTYRQHYRGFARTDESRPFEACIFEVSLKEMIDRGYLTTPKVEDAPIAQYDFSSLNPNDAGSFPQKEVNELLVAHKRVTHSIVEQIIDLSEREGRKGVMIFAATVAHAEEIVSYLPEGESALILGDTPSRQRDENISAFQEKSLRYLVNVSVLTTGFDAPHVDLIAILRPTESVSLFQQIVGRGLRISPGKSDCLVIDYAGNGFNIFAPEIGARKPTSDSVIVPVSCPVCDFENQFWGQMDEDGRVLEHFGRRCTHLMTDEEGHKKRCDYRFRFKECEKCNAENDIAARRCHACQAVLVDPDDQLKNSLRLKDALVLRVSTMLMTEEGSRLRVSYHDDEGTKVSEFFDFSHPGQVKVFNRIFSRRLASGRSPLDLTSLAHVEQLKTLFPKPDFVVARKQKTRPGRTPWFRVQTRIFDYEGRYRKAFEL